MNFLHAILILLATSFFICGCQQQEKPDVAVDAARAKFRYIKTSLNNGRTGVKTLFSAANEIGGVIASISNAARRTELALELSDTILSVDLTNQPYVAFYPTGARYSPRDSATIYYSEFINATCLVMRGHGCSARSIMEFFFKALQKYRDACLSIPLDLKTLPGETLEISSARRNCAHGAYAFYAETMSQIRRSLLPDKPPIFYVPPAELQEEFKCRLEPFFDFPSKEEFNEMMHPGYKHAPPLPPKPDEQKQVPAKPEDAVEVDI